MTTLLKFWLSNPFCLFNSPVTALSTQSPMPPWSDTTKVKKRIRMVQQKRLPTKTPIIYLQSFFLSSASLFSASLTSFSSRWGLGYSLASSIFSSFWSFLFLFSSSFYYPSGSFIYSLIISFNFSYSQFKSFITGPDAVWWWNYLIPKSTTCLSIGPSTLSSAAQSFWLSISSYSLASKFKDFCILASYT